LVGSFYTTLPHHWIYCCVYARTLVLRFATHTLHGWVLTHLVSGFYPTWILPHPFGYWLVFVGYTLVTHITRGCCTHTHVRGWFCILRLVTAHARVPLLPRIPGYTHARPYHTHTHAAPHYTRTHTLPRSHTLYRLRYVTVADWLFWFTFPVRWLVGSIFVAGYRLVTFYIYIHHTRLYTVGCLQFHRFIAVTYCTVTRVYFTHTTVLVTLHAGCVYTTHVLVVQFTHTHHTTLPRTVTPHTTATHAAHLPHHAPFAVYTRTLHTTPHTGCLPFAGYARTRYARAALPLRHHVTFGYYAPPLRQATRTAATHLRGAHSDAPHNVCLTRHAIRCTKQARFGINNAEHYRPNSARRAIPPARTTTLTAHTALPAFLPMASLLAADWRCVTTPTTLPSPRRTATPPSASYTAAVAFGYC